MLAPPVPSPNCPLVQRLEDFEDEDSACDANDERDRYSMRGADVTMRQNTVAQPRDRECQQEGRMNSPRTLATDRALCC
ncbi:MAG: hypothetical protein JWM53_5480 [bacterium]|nr:hypothetical protein [bacterium]